MTITSRVETDSISPQGLRLITVVARYPRFIHAEELTHRILSTSPELVIYEAIPDGLMYDSNLSRNASSSRAIPIKRMIEDLRRDPAKPIYWGSHKPGMQAGAAINTKIRLPVASVTGSLYEQELTPEEAWLWAMENAIRAAEAYAAAGYHKQIVNRLLEPWAHINVVITATEDVWNGFFALRSHKDAQPEIQMLSDLTRMAIELSTPTVLVPGQWHLPFVRADEWEEVSHAGLTIDPEAIDEVLRKVSVARCARTSYYTHDGRPTTIEEDTALYESLVAQVPLHASPAEHQATPDSGNSWGWAKGGPSGNVQCWDNVDEHGNLPGWRQFRKILEKTAFSLPNR